jgi:hypothetical protein
VLNVDQISRELADEFLAAVRLLQAHGRPELTPHQAVLEAIDDWITLARFEHFDGEGISLQNSQPSGDQARNLGG